MKKSIIIGCLMACLLMCLPISTGLELKGISLNNDGISYQMDPIVVSVNGGIGININIENVDEDTLVNTVVTGCYSSLTSNYYPFYNRMTIHINTFKLSTGKINLDISVNDQSWSYEATSTLFFFVYGIRSVE